ncbi:putative bifunctional diguanylate cyclase/phosphodiesterase [Pseudomonas sp. CFBP 13719]|uniref:putative bifunctional diguanylate cyclase/phosphodiesterase n=1 Tax=Pseudomonas sp. CFBP 13719 TaxID=2775303 RepID=UPI00177D826B|nr:GGDEF domain-containing phosphodiesterase [Pseudomonas sp. CFBP 13719]MBD8682793.1 EAL domain-containing protein [Pseudomonas sp. CFBP 13719]
MLAAVPEKDSKHTALQGLVQAAAAITHCCGGLLIEGAPGAWRVTAAFGTTREVPVDAATESWLRMLMSYGDVVDIGDGSPFIHSIPDFLGSLADTYRVCIAVKDHSDALVGIVLLALTPPFKLLSPAQIYALKTHSVALYHPAPSLLVPTSTGPAGVIERLRLLESVVVHAKDAILITEAEPIDQPGPRIVYCNPAFLATTGFSLQEIVGKTPRILQCEETDRGTLDQIRSALSKWQPIEVELINTRRDGTRFWVQLSIVPVANEKGWFTHWVSVQRDITERKEAEESLKQAQIDREEQVALRSRLVERERIQEELTYAAFHDDLTRLKNRAYFMAKIQEVFNLDHAEREAAVLYMDLDRFKYINDGMGHRAGDILLQIVAQRLESCLNGNAVLARIGGDEFAILHTGNDSKHAAIETAQRVIQALGVAVDVEGQAIFTSCSVGIVTLDAAHTSAEDLVRDADVAMYAAKKRGQGKWTLFDLSMRQAAVDLLLMRNALKHALAREEFYLVYQPIFAARSRRIEGVEALVRWQHPVLGNVPPDVFIAVAEDIGIIHEMGRWVMQTACAELKRWNANAACTLKLNVNVSGAELNHVGFVAKVAEILKDTSFSAHNLQIEITESVFLNEPETVAIALADLRELGVHIALDDFGTGYSSLGYIDRYPIDSIKIDRSFVTRMMTHRRTIAIVTSILSLGSALDVDIVAEGVETQDQLDRLQALGCPFVQGYLLSPPLRGEEMKQLMAARDDT